MFGVSAVPPFSHSSNIFISSRRAFFQLLNASSDSTSTARPIRGGFGSSIEHSTLGGQPLRSSVDLPPYFGPLCICRMDVIGPRDYPTRKRIVGTIFPASSIRFQHQGYPSPAPHSNHFPSRNMNSNSNSPRNVLECLRYHAELPILLSV